MFELENTELKYIRHLNDIIPNNFIKLIKEHNIITNYLGIVRLLLMIDDINSYLDNYVKYYITDWNITSMEVWDKFIVEYGIPYSYIQKILDEKGL